MKKEGGITIKKSQLKVEQNIFPKVKGVEKNIGAKCMEW